MKDLVISARHESFIEHLSQGESILESGKKAGFSEDQVNRDAVPIALTPKIRTLLRGYIKGKIDIEGSPMAYKTLIRLLQKEDTATGHKIEIAKFLLSHSIAAPKAEVEGADTEKDPSQMTNDELHDYLKRTDAELVRRGHLVDVTPVQGVDSVI